MPRCWPDGAALTLAPAPLYADDAPRGGQAWWLHTADGVRLRLAHWPGANPVLILPGRTEYIEKYGLVVRDLAAAGRGALVIDWRGQGLADRLAEDAALGHVGAFSDYQLDLAAALQAASRLAPGPLPWIAHSMGGCIALRALIDGLRPTAVVLCAPMLGFVEPVAKRLGIAALATIARPFGRDRAYVPTTGPDYGLPSMDFAGNPLTNDPVQFARMQGQIRERDGLTLGGPSLRWGGAALAEMRALARQPSPPVPALIALGSDERIVDAGAVRRRAADWTARDPRSGFVEYPGARHELLMEDTAVRDDLMRRILAHLAANTAAP